MSPPEQPSTIDGHCWVVRDGKIIDPHFQTYNHICMIRGVNVNKQVWIPAQETVQNVFLTKWTEFVEYVLEVSEELNDWENKPDYCFINAILEQKKNGGTLVFGSMGWGDWIEYGHNDKECRLINRYLKREDVFYWITHMVEIESKKKFGVRFGEI